MPSIRPSAKKAIRCRATNGSTCTRRATAFVPPPEPTRYDGAFVAAYRAAQKERVAGIDVVARTMIQARRTARERAKASPADATEMRRATAVAFLTLYRTEADLRYVDASLDPSDRDYGSLFGHRPDVINYGPFGFARVVTPEAWLSTWSGLSSRASIPANGPEVGLPALVASYTGDNAVFPSDTREIHDSLACADKTMVEVRGDHYGHPLPGSSRWGRDDAVEKIVEWMRARGY
jgi:hypothetical protein